MSNESFDVIDASDYPIDDDDEKACAVAGLPWTSKAHPLYFPDVQSAADGGRWKALNRFSVESWYPLLREQTFETVFLPLSVGDVRVFLGENASEAREANLAQRIDEALGMFRGRGAFMRLSTRSPKDSSYLLDAASNRMAEDRQNWPTTDNGEQQRVSFVVAMLSGMHVHQSREVLDMIRGSPRMLTDFVSLTSTIDDSERRNDETCVTQLVLREWVTMRPDHEFRVFVARHRDEAGSMRPFVTAISQYFHFLVFDVPQDSITHAGDSELDHLGQAICKYIEEVVDPLLVQGGGGGDNSFGNDPYIIDLGLVSNAARRDDGDSNVTMDPARTVAFCGKSYTLCVVELNAFAPAATGSMLFDWKTELELLWGGRWDEKRGQFEPVAERPSEPAFRVRRSPRPDLTGVTLLPAGFRVAIDRAVGIRKASDR